MVTFIEDICRFNDVEPSQSERYVRRYGPKVLTTKCLRFYLQSTGDANQDEKKEIRKGWNDDRLWPLCSGISTRSVCDRPQPRVFSLLVNGKTSVRILLIHVPPRWQMRDPCDFRIRAIALR